MTAKVQAVPRELLSRNPANGEVLREFQCADEAEVQAAVASARSVQKSWEQRGVGGRVALLRRFERLLYEKRSEVARLITQEAGKPYVEALLTEVMVTLEAARFYARNAPRMLQRERIPHANLALKAKSGWLLREAHGVVGIVSPWNYPFCIPATQAMAALVAGNAVVLKPSEFTPQCALELQTLMRAAGLPEEIFQVLIGDGITGALLSASAIDKLVFTGSLASGKRVAQAAALRLLPVVLELGGKDPMLVLDDADVEIASSAAIWGAFVNAGQACLSVERCYVHRRLYAGFVSACVEKTKKLILGDGMDPRTEVGPLISPQQVKTVERHLEDAKAQGARVLTGGVRVPQLGTNFYEPTVIADVDHSMLIMREETFGPVLPIMAFDNDDEAIRLANDSEFGLAASIWTRNRARGEALAARIQAGTVMVNDVISCFGISEAPHGGVKSSGLGRTHGRMGLEEMVRLKYVDSDLLPRMRKVWWYGYGPEFTGQMEAFMELLFAPRLREKIRGALKSAGSLLRKGKL